jgi:hypothetical protein
MFTNNDISSLQDLYCKSLMLRPSNVIQFSRSYFSAEHSDNPKIAHAYGKLRHTVHDADEFCCTASIIFCDELSALGDAEADEITIKSLTTSIKRLLRDNNEPDLAVSLGLLEGKVMDQVPSEGSISFKDFVAYMRFIASCICMRYWLHRLYLLSAKIVSNRRDNKFDKTRLMNNLVRLPFDLRQEGRIDVTSWLKTIMTFYDKSQIEFSKNEPTTPDAMFEKYLTRILQHGATLGPS